MVMVQVTDNYQYIILYIYIYHIGISFKEETILCNGFRHSLIIFSLDTKKMPSSPLLRVLPELPPNFRQRRQQPEVEEATFDNLTSSSQVVCKTSAVEQKILEVQVT